MVLAILNASYELRCRGAIPELENTYADLETGIAYFARPDFPTREIEVTIMPQGSPHFTEWFRVDDVAQWAPVPESFLS